ncbi:MAG: vitamin K epoxide reductase family protein [Candidatus Spechtbacterales bacterium]|nr:vitamin K epoxide reductase family protein [Candidatus Spechtbacterales bacterium]
MIKTIQKNIFLYLLLITIGFGGLLFSTTLPTDIAHYAFIVALSFGGFMVALYIFYKKKFNKELVCPVGSNCNTVIYSEYSKFLGINLEYLGMFYYVTIFASYLTYITMPGQIPPLFVEMIFLLTAGAFLFSLYLLSVQGFLLKQWCMWCLLSAVFSIIIFIIALEGINFAEIILTGLEPVFSLLHFFGFAFGVGGASVAAFLFLKSLRDYKISDSEMGVLRTISEIIWFALVLILVSQFAIYIPNIEQLNSSPQFIVKMLALGIVVLGGVVVNLVLAPYVSSIHFKEDSKIPDLLHDYRKATFIVSAVSLISWYSAFALSVINLEYSLEILATGYGLLLILAVIAALIAERRVSHMVALFREEDQTSVQV